MIAPNKTDPVLIINPNTVLPSPVTAQFLEPVTGRTPQIVQFYCHIEDS
ncbi:MAG TPA: hypothetical protein VNZ03_04235 [Terriglobales bacterium]|nr:hypothetical protein [Terriglobales bacterium]